MHLDSQSNVLGRQTMKDRMDDVKQDIAWVAYVNRTHLNRKAFVEHCDVPGKFSRKVVPDDVPTVDHLHKSLSSYAIVFHEAVGTVEEGSEFLLHNVLRQIAIRDGTVQNASSRGIGIGQQLPNQSLSDIHHFIRHGTQKRHGKVTSVVIE